MFIHIYKISIKHMPSSIGCVLTYMKDGTQVTEDYKSLFSCGKKYYLSVAQIKALAVDNPKDRLYRGNLPQGATIKLLDTVTKGAQSHWICSVCNRDMLIASKSNHLVSYLHRNGGITKGQVSSKTQLENQVN